MRIVLLSPVAIPARTADRSRVPVANATYILMECWRCECPLLSIKNILERTILSAFYGAVPDKHSNPSLWKCGMPAFQDVAAVWFLGKGKDNTRASYGDVIQTP